ncbi:pimeloyl-CoA dehydrogenase small subunit [Seongchinamella unica]|uniref:Pimeloyl-CoA dehydrogenase small subunit n=1 Tax=Seongchinamella unica TaxID=2547392 RepID=A0A4R5LU29_9GAMM|nr:acyl-CoA dehydrogenase [Seongchinamella unica]TDG14860.1 pimeloyl-CoA dehydrogenase small subunit [Seongchinamella unica]
MNFSLSEEQLLLRESVEKYVADHGGVDRHRRLSRTQTGYDAQCWQTFAELGWLALPFAEASGGLGGSVTDLMVFSEALGKGLVREPYLHCVVTCGGILSQAGSDAQQEQWMPGLLHGDSQWAFAPAEAASGFDLESVTTRAVTEGDGYRVSGSKTTVFNGHVADNFIVTARLDSDELGLLVVPADSPGLGRRPFTAVDGSRGAALLLENVAVPAGNVLGQPGQSVAVLEQVLNRAIVALGAESLGAMQVLLDTTVAYCKTREQFGQPIGKFQALQHRMADMYLKLEETRSLLYNAAILLDEGNESAPAACAALKVKLGEAGRFIAHESVQLHGGIGMTDELIVSHLFKRLLLLAKLYGDGDYHLQRYIQLQAA